MPFRTKHRQKISELLKLFSKDDNWLILITADPDAMASAMALKRIMARRTGKVVIARTNNITRPDNLAMIRYLRIPMVPMQKELVQQFDKFAIVDSQPHHNIQFQDIDFSIIIDHHPTVENNPAQAPYTDITPSMGATSTMFTEYLRALRIIPGALLATALQYGIRTDTASFTRNATEQDMRAYQYLAKYANPIHLTNIMRSEYLPDWLKFFSHAFTSLHPCGRGQYTFLGLVENTDILVVIADFFTRVHGLKWIAVCGVHHPKGTKEEDAIVVVVFRGNDSYSDVGELAMKQLGHLGTAGGHKHMARAEFPMSCVDGKNVEIFVFKQLADTKSAPDNKK